MSYPPYTYDNQGNKSDPVNLVYKKTSALEVSNFLKQSDGWADTVGYDQYLNLPNGNNKVNDMQLEKGSFFTSRFHMRLWDVMGDCIGSAHYETFQLIRHEVHHFEGAERKVADTFHGFTAWVVADDAQILNDEEYEKYNDGKVTIISKSGGP
jgi:hypothetical protein